MGSVTFRSARMGCMWDTKKLNAAYIEKTWRSLHPEVVQRKPESESVKPTSTLRTVQPKQSVVGNGAKVPVHLSVAYREYNFHVPVSIFDLIREETFKPDDTTKVTPEEKANIALLLFAGYLDAATSMAASCGGGGTSNDMGWGRDPKEDEREWAIRCAHQAQQLSKPSAYRRKR